MKDEIGAAVVFLSRLIKKPERFSQSKIDEFRNRLEELLIEQFQDHWFPDNPFKGQGYRCIRVNETERMDPILKRAAEDCGLNYNELNLPNELTIWVDPNEVCCRLGEHKGSYCTVAKFKNGNKGNYANQINIEHLEKKSAELAKQASAEIMSGYRRNHRRVIRNDHSVTPPHQRQMYQQPHTYSPITNNLSPLHYTSPCSSPAITQLHLHNNKHISPNIRRNLLHANANLRSNEDGAGSTKQVWTANGNVY